MATTGTTGNHTQRISAVLTEDAWQGDADAVLRVDGTIAFQGQIVAQNSLEIVIK